MDAHVRDILMEGGILVEDMLERCMGSEALLIRLLKKFPADSSFGRLETAFRNEDEAAALEAAHTLKGVCGNLSVAELFKLLEGQVALLREHDMAGTASMMPDVSRRYHAAVQAIAKAFD